MFIVCTIWETLCALCSDDIFSPDDKSFIWLIVGPTTAPHELILTNNKTIYIKLMFIKVLFAQISRAERFNVCTILDGS